MSSVSALPIILSSDHFLSSDEDVSFHYIAEFTENYLAFHDVTPGEINSTEVNAKFDTFISNFRLACTQWSRIVAWTWTDHDEENQAGKELKKAIIKVLQEQALYSRQSYNKRKALEKSNEINQYLTGEKRVGEMTIESILPLKSEEKYAFNKEFMEYVHPVVNLDSFSGGLSSFDYSLNGGKGKFLVVLAYPPCPTFSHVTVMEEQVRSWATTGETKESTWLPPSAYIPTCGC